MSDSLTLVITNKNYSSWSLRPWLVMTEFCIPFKERLVKLDSEDWRINITDLSPTRLVPVLWEGEPGDGFATFDSIAILERLHELYPQAGIWPADARCRARARSLVADFHAGCHALRTAMPMNIRTHYPGKGMNDEVARDIERLCGQWSNTRREFGDAGDFLFGKFSAADAFFTPVASRLDTYAVDLDDEAEAYQQTLLNTRAMRIWTAQALEETEFVIEDEPYA